MKKINILIFEIILLMLIIYGNLVFIYHKNKNKKFEVSKNISIFKAFEILRAHQFNFLLKENIIFRL